jgi:hypothetical protein
MNTDYSDYTIPICDNPAMYGITDQREATMHAQRIESAARVRWPGVHTYRFLTGHESVRITGPNGAVRDAMHDWLRGADAGVKAQ